MSLILLTMVKNESRIIERLLNSVKDKVAATIVCDTGSTDNTVELATACIQNGKVYQFPFVNFGVSRTTSFHKAQEWVIEQGWDPFKTWALLLDGDMVGGDIDMEALASETANPLVAGISLKQMNGDMVYSNVRLIRCSEPWICKGGTHEAWTCPDGKRVSHFDAPILKDYNDGGCKSDKYSRDIRLLLEDIVQNPTDARSYFYLGQTYIGLRDWVKAIDILKRRIAIGGWDEETYYAKVYLGEAYENIGDKAQATQTWLEAWQSRRWRTEAMMKLITMWRKEARAQHVAWMFLDQLYAAQTGKRLDGTVAGPPLKNNDLLFVNQHDMAVQFWEELGILAYYCGPEAKAAALRLIDEYDLTNTLNWHQFNNIFGHLKWYDTVLDVKSTRFSIPLARLPWAAEDSAQVWQAFNPSIRADASGYLVNLRYANYWTEEAKHYQFRGFHGRVLTRNCLMRTNGSWNDPTSVEEIVIDPSIPQRDDHIQGVEDCRLIQGSDELEFLGTSRSYSSNGSNKIMKVWFDTAWTLKELPLPAGVNPEDTQKNWLGFRKDGKLHYIYSYSPMRVCLEDGTDVPVPSTYSLKEYRGSAGPVPYEDGYLAVVHKVHIGDGRRYYHRFLKLNADFSIAAVSRFVRMTQERVEYWSGLCCSPDGYYVTYGLKDSEAYIAEIRKEMIDGLF
jgi:glycosyltransferase involved in cell wall biosynthesis